MLFRSGTGAAPFIAKIAKEMGILTIAIVTIPFLFEGTNRVNQAIEGVIEMRKYVDAIIIMNNERIKLLYGDLALSKAFANADNVLTIAAKGIAEIITAPGTVNVDLNDVRTVMTDSGDAIMGAATASGPDRASEDILKALDSPLLLSNDIRGTKNILLNISYGDGDYEITMDEIGIITGHLEKQVGPGTQIIWGATVDEKLEDKLSVTVVATGFSLDKSSLSGKGEIVNEPVAQNVVTQQPEAKKQINIDDYYGQMNNRSSNFSTHNNQASQNAQKPQEQNIVTLDLNEPSLSQSSLLIIFSVVKG